MITMAPLPSWKNILKLVKKIWYRPQLVPIDQWKGQHEKLGILSRSTWSLALIVQWRNRETGNKVRMWIPDFFCNSALIATLKEDVELVFYPVTDELLPDQRYCRLYAKTTLPDIFLFVHFFGIPQKLPFVTDFCKATGAWLVEDATHALKRTEAIGMTGDFVLFSPYKHLPLPDAAVLIASPQGPSKLSENFLKGLGDPTDWWQQLDSISRLMGISQNRSGILACIWLIKRILQKFRIGRTYAKVQTIATDPDSAAVLKTLTSPRISRMGHALLKMQDASLFTVTRIKQRNTMLYDDLVLRVMHQRFNITSYARPENREWTPYMAVYKTDPTAYMQTFARLAVAGLPVTSWPDLPPDIEEVEGSRATELKKTFIHIPVHASIRMRDFKKYGTETVSDTIGLQVREVKSSEEWHHLLMLCGNSSLLQSWAYGEAKRQTEGSTVKRLVFVKEDTPIAIVQKLVKKMGIFSIQRVNQGPLFCLGQDNRQNRASVMQKLASEANLLCPLLIAPFLHLNGDNLRLLQELRFINRSYKGYESISLDLKKDIAILRKELHPKWRNMLNYAEKAGLELKICEDNATLEWLIKRYQENMTQKKFKGVSPALLRVLHGLEYTGHALPVLQAFHNGEPIAGILLIVHSTCATYLVGWNGDEGRNLKANQFLLWNAMCFAKEKGLISFDMGGIDNEQNPHITFFKSGIGGRAYQLLGEYLK